MQQVAQSIDLNLSQSLRDPEYRRRFFLAESSARIAAQLIALRKKRGYSQKELAKIAGTKQPAISRAEQADYQNWSFSTLRNIAQALDARIRVDISPSEDILSDYEDNGFSVNFKSTPSSDVIPIREEAVVNILSLQNVHVNGPLGGFGLFRSAFSGTVVSSTHAQSTLNPITAATTSSESSAKWGLLPNQQGFPIALPAYVSTQMEESCQIQPQHNVPNSAVIPSSQQEYSKWN